MDGLDHRLFINYNSFAGRISHSAWDYAWGGGTWALPIDPIMMYSLRDNIRKLRQEHMSFNCRLGVVMIDFFNCRGNDDDCHNTEAIINTNYTTPIY